MDRAHLPDQWFWKMHRNNQRYRRPNAFTLIELILVLGVMVMIFSLAIPLAARAMGTHALRQSADLVRVAMGQARVKAIKSGQVQALFFEIESSWFNVAPFVQFTAQQSLASRQAQLAGTAPRRDFDDNQLPAGIVFASGVTSTDGRAADVFNSIGGSGSSSNIQPILFYPDGTSQDAQVYLKDDKANFTSVQLRGLTGIAKTVPTVAR